MIEMETQREKGRGRPEEDKEGGMKKKETGEHFAGLCSALVQDYRKRPFNQGNKDGMAGLG